MVPFYVQTVISLRMIVTGVKSTNHLARLTTFSCKPETSVQEFRCVKMGFQTDASLMALLVNQNANRQPITELPLSISFESHLTQQYLNL